MIGAFSAAARADDQLAALYAELADPANPGWSRAESDILRAWSQSGSAAMDLLLKRGEAALDQGDTAQAIQHLTALTDHAPDFAGGWAARAAAFYLAGQPGPAIDDAAQALRLEPHHFAVLTLLGTIFDEMGETDRAVAAFDASLAIHPHQQEAIDARARLRQVRDGIAL
ncbi:tetratricopeptide repeat protein [Paracoccus sp. p4-l81]|uniref:tetratricopeptide repeat protein n=1 Tax=unclassified Paracoccus (in: a-proteobacteria) TaxID=2688777 RepID=UPI0035B6FA63